MSVVLVITKQIAIRIGTFISVDHKIRNYICFTHFWAQFPSDLSLRVWWELSAVAVLAKPHRQVPWCDAV